MATLTFEQFEAARVVYLTFVSALLGTAFYAVFIARYTIDCMEFSS